MLELVEASTIDLQRTKEASNIELSPTTAIHVFVCACNHIYIYIFMLFLLRIDQKHVPPQAQSFSTGASTQKPGKADMTSVLKLSERLLPTLPTLLQSCHVLAALPQVSGHQT